MSSPDSSNWKYINSDVRVLPLFASPCHENKDCFALLMAKNPAARQAGKKPVHRDENPRDDEAFIGRHCRFPYGTTIVCDMLRQTDKVKAVGGHMILFRSPFPNPVRQSLCYCNKSRSRWHQNRTDEATLSYLLPVFNTKLSTSWIRVRY